MAQVRMGIEVKGLREFLKDLSTYGKEVSKRAREESKKIAQDEAEKISIRASTSGDKVAAAVGVTVRARSDRVPAIVSGGARRLSTLSGKPRAGAVFFGAEFGGGGRPTTRQFRPHKGKTGYFLWPQLREDEREMVERWLTAIEGILEDHALNEQFEQMGG